MVANFAPSIALSSISVLTSSGFLFHQCRAKSIAQLKKSVLSIMMQVLMILCQCFVIASLCAFMNCQDLYNVNAWTLMDVSSLLILAMLLLLTLINLRILAIFAPSVTNYDLSEKRIQMFRVAIILFWMVCAALHYFYQISWSVLNGGDQFAFLALASNFSAILFGLLVSIYEAIQASIILQFILTSKMKDAVKHKREATNLIFVSLISMFLLLTCYGMGLFVDYSIAIPLYSALYFFAAIHAITAQLTLNVLVQIFRKGVAERKVFKASAITANAGGGVSSIQSKTVPLKN